MQLAQQDTSPTQPFPVGDAVVPQYIDMPPEGFDLINQGRIFTPFSQASRGVETAGRRQLAAELLRSAVAPDVHLRAGLAVGCRRWRSQLSGRTR